MSDSAFLHLAVPGVRSLRPYQPGKPLDELAREYGVTDAVKLASNENPLGPGPRALEALQAALGELSRYPDGNGFALKQALAERLGVNAEQITLGNGSSDVLELVVRAFVAPTDEVMFSAHSFAVYPILTQAVGARAVVTSAREWGNDLAAMQAALTARTRLVFIANPNNPTGTWLDGPALEAFVAGLPPHVLVVVDEAYFEYATAAPQAAGSYPNALDWVGRYPNLIVARTFSKAYGLAGLRVGYAVSHPDVANLLNRVRQPFNVNGPALAAAAAALADEEHLARSLDVNTAGMQTLTQGFAARGLGHIPSVGNFVCVDMGRDALPVYDALLTQGVIVRPVANYGMPRHLRITVGTAAENARLLAALDRVLAAWPGTDNERATV